MGKASGELIKLNNDLVTLEAALQAYLACEVR